MQWVEDDDEYLEEDEEDFPYDEQEWENERFSQCTCGSYVWSNKECRFLHVADCSCGRT
jgi:hypothetical protein